MKLDSYWLDTAPAFSHAAQGAVEGRADVVVIGGGFTGLSAALALAKCGVSVTVLEAGQVASQASGRNGGQCNTGIAQDFASLAASMGLQQARDFYMAYASAVASVEEIVTQEGINCHLIRTGKLKLAAKPKHFEKLERTHDVLLREVDTDIELIPAQQLRREIGSDGFFGGLLQRNGVQMHMGEFGVGLASAAARHGARIFQQAEVTGLKRLQGDRYEVSSTRGTIHADHILVATGAASGGPLQWFRRRLAPVGSFIVVTEPLEKSRLDALLPTRRSYVTSLNIGNYFRVTPDDRLLWGGRARFAMSNPLSDEKSGDILRQSLAKYFPSLAKARIDYCWGGLIDVTADRLPRAGQHEGMFYSMGYSGHGVQMSTHMGRVMAAMIVEKMGGVATGAPSSTRPSKNPWGDLPWTQIPGHFGSAWFLPLVGAYYRLQDILH